MARQGKGSLTKGVETMSVKRKFRRKAKVIPLHDTMVLCSSPGVHMLAEETGLPLDELFLSYLWMAIQGLIQIQEKLTPDDQPRLLTVLPEGMHDVKRFRREFISGSLIDPADLPAWYDLRKIIFPDLPPPVSGKYPIYKGGIHAILDDTQLDIDYVFLNLFRLTVHGLIQPIEEKLSTGRVKLNFKMAISELDIKVFRNLLIKGLHLSVTDLPAWRAMRDDLLGVVEPEPDDDF